MATYCTPNKMSMVYVLYYIIRGVLSLLTNEHPDIIYIVYNNKLINENFIGLKGPYQHDAMHASPEEENEEDGEEKEE